MNTNRPIAQCYAITSHQNSFLADVSPLDTADLKEAILLLCPIDHLTVVLLHSLSRDDALTHEDVDQRLQWLHILAAQQIIVHGDGDKMHETAIQLKMPIDVPEWVLPVSVVQVRIAAEHLLDDASDVGVEVGGKARGFANPVVVLAGELGKRSRKRGRRGCNRRSSGVHGRGGRVTGGKGSGGD